MTRPVAIVVFGMGGYGDVYLEALLKGREGVPCILLGAVDPEPRRCRHLDALKRRGVKIYPSGEDYFGEHLADLAVVSSPIHFHASQTCLALSMGGHVLCEKPAAATVEQVDRMLACSRRHGRFVAVGYQWSFSRPIQALKRDILSGRFGAPRRMKTLCLWPRDEGYYRRNDWAGRLTDSRGRQVLDSPANNAKAHFLHNLLYLLGDRMDQSALPGEVEAELFRANRIESFDTAALRVRTDDDVEILFYASHAVPRDLGPMFALEFEEATVTYDGGSAPILARFRDGAEKRYESPESESQMRKLWTCIEAASRGGAIPCGLEAARAHTLCVQGIHEGMHEISEFPPALLRTSGPGDNRLIWVEGLSETLRACYEEGLLPGERKRSIAF